MADLSTASLLAQLSRDERPDHALLTAFTREREQAAFEALVSRYARLVHGVCRRMLGNHQDAEDAFQATFVVLARKAGTLDPAVPLASWLHGVAVRVVRTARRKNGRRERREQRARPMTPTETWAADAVDDRWPALEAELARLPGRHRDPIVLCYLQRLSHREAAEALDIPPGSMARRVEQGLDVLRDRLKGRGVVLSAAVLTATLTEAGAGASARPALIAATVRAGMGGVLSVAVRDLVAAGLGSSIGSVRVWAAILACAGVAGAGVMSLPPAVEVQGTTPAVAQQDAGGPVVVREHAAGPRIARFEMPVWRPDPLNQRRVSLDKVKPKGTTPLKKSDRYVWEVELDRAGPVLLLRVLPDGTEQLCHPTDSTAVPEVATGVRCPPIPLHNGGLGFDVAGNQLFVVIAQKTPEAYAAWAARKPTVPWTPVNGDGLWAFDPDLGVKEMAAFNGALRAPNPETRRLVEAAASHYLAAPNVSSVRIYGLSIRGN
jgi:RNA polymerase sigma factor (sigma-70 family)